MWILKICLDLHCIFCFFVGSFWIYTVFLMFLCKALFFTMFYVNPWNRQPECIVLKHICISLCCFNMYLTVLFWSTCVSPYCFNMYICHCIVLKRMYLTLLFWYTCISPYCFDMYVCQCMYCVVGGGLSFFISFIS